MSRDLVQTIRDVIETANVEPFFAFDLKFDAGELNLWTGLGDKTINGKIYTGTGNLLSISNIEETTEIAARGATFTLTGISSSIISLALTEPYQGRECNIFLGALNFFSPLETDNFCPIFVTSFKNQRYGKDDNLADYSEIFSGYMDQLNIEENGETSNVVLTVENRLVDLERQRVKRYTSGFQKSIYPDDRGFDFVEDIQDKEIVWGRLAAS